MAFKPLFRKMCKRITVVILHCYTKHQKEYTPLFQPLVTKTPYIKFRYKTLFQI